jgi:glycosyltransferase involved in cell wall biosynthesis
LRICLVFDCLYPYTVGGGERWYRALAEGLAGRGRRVTYLTRLQWEPASGGADVPGVDVIAVAPAMELYVEGRRSVSVQLRFALGVFRHLLVHGARYDVVQTPALHVSLLAVLAARPFRRFQLVVDWFEVWTREYWLEYLGGVAGRLGWAAQRFTARSRHEALSFSRLHARRLEQLGHRGPVTLVEGLSVLADDDPAPVPTEPLVVFAGRQIPEKQAPAVVRAVAHARERIPGLEAEIFGDGPERGEVLRLIAANGLDGIVRAPGFAAAEEVRERLRRALCHLFPSRREGYGIVVVEAAALGTPTVVVESPDNAALELVVDGENGVVARSAEPEELAAAILRVHAAGAALRQSTVEWFRRNRKRLSLESTLDALDDVYRR